MNPPFTLSSFAQQDGFRIFRFRRFAADGKPLEFTVRAETSKLHQHGISLQDLPLLCQELLQRTADDEQPRDFTFTEEHMRDCARNRAFEKANSAANKASGPRSGARETFRNPGALPATSRSDEGGWL